MKIAIVAPPWITLPAEDNSGIESTIFNLAQEYDRKSEEVLLFAPAGSVSSAPMLHYPEIPSGINLNAKGARFYIKHILAKYAYRKAESEGAGIIHDFTLGGEYDISIPVVHTVYGPPTESTVQHCFQASHFPGNYMVAVSNRQRGEFSEISPDITFMETISKCINTEKIKWSGEKENYILYFGRQEEKKNLELAKRVASRAKKRLVDVICGTEKKGYGKLKPWLGKETKSMDIRLSEDLPRKSRYNLYRSAQATVHINNWREPFAMEILESLACGTPVIALRKGSASEIIEDGETGFLVETEKEMVEAVKKISSIQPRRCRKAVEERFSSSVIADRYLKLYRTLPKI